LVSGQISGALQHSNLQQALTLSVL